MGDNHIPNVGGKVKVKFSLRSGRFDYIDFETEIAAKEFIWSIHRSENIKRAVIVR